MPIYAIDGVTPVIHPTAYVHPSAVLIGDVIVGAHCYVAPLASLRGDFGRLILEEGSNLQDTCVMHGFPNMDTVIEKNGHVGHGAVLHGCRVGENALIGMNAVVMDGAVIGEASIVAAASFVKASFNAPARHLIAGTPAKIMRELSDEDIAWKSAGTAAYQQLTLRSLHTMQEVDALTEVEADRKRVQHGDIKPLHQSK